MCTLTHTSYMPATSSSTYEFCNINGMYAVIQRVRKCVRVCSLCLIYKYEKIIKIIYEWM
jgi:hypothetical protein